MLLSFDNLILYYVCLALVFKNVSASPFRRNHAQTNLIFIMFDDLRLELFHYGRKYMKTPNFDRLASKSVTFDNAYCQIAVCNPSRDSLLTGLRPDTVGTYGFQHSWAPHMLLPQQLIHSNYHTAAYGKVMHWDADHRNVWSLESWQGDWYAYQNSEGGKYMNASVQPDNVWKEEQFRDYILMTHALSGLEKLHSKSREDKNHFMLSIGYKLPHIALHVPQKYWDMYKDTDARDMWENDVKTTSYPSDAPLAGYRCCVNQPFQHMTDGGVKRATKRTTLGNVSTPFPDSGRDDVMRGYAAAVSFVDSQLGRLLDRIDAMSLWENVTIVLTSDHGMHNGEKGIW